MRRKVFVLLALAVSLISVASCTVYYSLYHTGKANVTGHPELTEYLDGVPLVNNTVIDWGDLEPGWDYSKNYTVVNTGNKPLTVTLRVQNLPVGWSLLWAANNTALDPGETAEGNLILSIPSSASETLHTWDQWLEGS